MIEIKNLTKKYGQQYIFNNVNFTFPSSGLVCLLGASGSGKSTLLNMLAGFDSDYSGTISVFDIALHNMNTDELCNYRKDNIGFVFQDYNLISRYTVLENILTASELNSNNDLRNKEKARTLLNQLNILDKENEKVENLSGGQKQRVAIVRALINNPSIILADEPTGALDRKNSTEIMELLKELSKSRLTIVITHDQKICAFADEVISIKEDKIVGKENFNPLFSKNQLKKNNFVKASTFHRGIKNFKVHLPRYMAVSVAIAIGVLAFILSLSTTNIVEQSIHDFKEKNTAFNNGYIKVTNNPSEIYTLLKDSNYIENIYQQYMIKNVTLNLGKKKETILEKYPMPKATETMSYGVMPKIKENEIALSPSLAKKFQGDINKLIGKELILKYLDTEYRLTISGIFNAGYDDFFVSSDIEQRLYYHISDDNPYSISYDVKNFKDIPLVNKMLIDKGVESKSAVKEVTALQNTFDNLSRLFFIVSILILSIGLFITVILLSKLQSSRYKEIGLLSALGYTQKQIRTMIISENLLLATVASIINATFIAVVYFVSTIFKIDIIFSIYQIVLSILGTAIIVIIISILVTYKLIHTEPAIALKK